MGEARDGDERPAGPVQVPQKAVPVPARREGRLDLSLPQVAGSAVAAVVAAKLASNLGVYGTILGAGVVSVLGTCGGSVLQHFFRRTGRQVQEVAVRPGVRGVRRDRGTPVGTLSETDPAATGPREPDRTDAVSAPDLTGTSPRRPDPTGTLSEPNRTGTSHRDANPTDAGPRRRERTVALSGAGSAGSDPAADGYGEATSYRARSRSWKRPVVAVALAFGLTMAGITGYEAIAGENISGHGHGTTIGNAVTGHDSPGHSGGTGGTPAPAGTTTGPHSRTDPETTPSQPRSGGTPSTGSGHDHATPPTPAAPPTTPSPTTPTAPTSPPPTSASPSATPSGETGDGGTGG